MENEIMNKMLLLFTALCMTVGIANADVWEDLAKYKMSDETEEPAPVRVEALIIQTPLDRRGPVEEALVKIVK